MNIPYLAAHLEKRAGKEESFDVIKRAINGEHINDNDWAILYSYFLPASPKKITSPFEWVSMICDQKEVYAFCKYILVDGERTISANTKITHILYSDSGLHSGWYDIKKGQVGDDVAIMPNIDQAIEESKGSYFDFDKKEFESGLFDIVDTPAGLSYVLPWCKKGVDKKYFDLMIKSISDVKIEYSENGPFRVDGSIKGIRCSAVIMPFKLNGFLEEKIEQETIEETEEVQLSFG